MNRKWMSLAAVFCLLLTLFSVSPLLVGAANEPQLKVSNGVLSDDGSKYAVEVSISNNPGIVAMRLKLDYDTENLELISVTDGDLLGDDYHARDCSVNPYYLFWENSDAQQNYTKNGVIATLQFKLRDSSKYGQYSVSLSAGEGDILDVNEDVVSFNMVAGTIKVSPDQTPDGPYAQLSDVTAETRLVTVPLKLCNNPGVASMQWEVSYNAEHMTLISVTDKTAFASTAHGADLSAVPYRLSFTNDSDVSGDGEVAYLTFELKDDAPDTISYTLTSVEESIVNAAGNAVKMIGVGGAITVPDSIRQPVKIESVSGGTVQVDRKAFYYGDRITVSAIPEEGCSFQYWLVDNRIYFGSELKLTISDDTTITPVFKQVETGEKVYTVRFFSYDGRLIDTLSSDEIADENNWPDVPYRYGYIRGCWADLVASDPIDSDMDVYPDYDENPQLVYEIKVEGGTLSDKTPNFEEKVTVTAGAKENFAAWVDEDEKAVSPHAEYTFFATESMKLTAKTTAQMSIPEKIIRINKTTGNLSTRTNEYRMSVIANTYVDQTKYTIVERGIIYTTDDATDFEVGDPGVRMKTASTTDTNQFMYSLTGVPKGVKITVRAYMRLKDANGKLSYEYSGVCNGTWTGEKLDEDDYLIDDEDDFDL